MKIETDRQITRHSLPTRMCFNFFYPPHKNFEILPTHIAHIAKAKDDNVNSVIQTKDGDFIIVGTTESKVGDSGDMSLIKTDKNGNLIWEKTIGGKNFDSAKSLYATMDGGFLLAGYTNSVEFEVLGNSDAWLVKTDSVGDVTWHKVYGDKGSDMATSVVQIDKEIFIAGERSLDGVSPYLWLVVTDEKGNLIQDVIIDGLSGTATSVLKTKSGDVFVCGYSSLNSSGSYDLSLIKLKPKK